MSATETDPGTTVRLIRQGNSWVLPLEAQMLRELGMDENALVSVALAPDRQSLIITPVANQPTPDALRSALEQVNREWGPVLKKLAK